MTAGHPTTPLAEELGLKPGMRAFIADMPDAVRSAIRIDDLGLVLLAAPSSGIDAAHIFVTARDHLEREVNALRQLIAPSGFIWVHWPEDGADGLDATVVQEVARSAGLAVTQSCALPGGWSGLRLAPSTSR